MKEDFSFPEIQREKTQVTVDLVETKSAGARTDSDIAGSVRLQDKVSKQRIGSVT